MMASDNQFWDFSIKIYSRGDVADACLRLQTARELDVNILLFCAWAGASGAPLFTPAQIADICALVDGWHEDVVRPLRSVRNRMKDNPYQAPLETSAALRNAVKSNELKAEQIEQDMLFAGHPVNANSALEPEQKRSAASKNMKTYLSHLGSRETPDESGWIETIVNRIEDK